MFFNISSILQTPLSASKSALSTVYFDLILHRSNYKVHLHILYRRLFHALWELGMRLAAEIQNCTRCIAFASTISIEGCRFNQANCYTYFWRLHPLLHTTISHILGGEGILCWKSRHLVKRSTTASNSCNIHEIGSTFQAFHGKCNETGIILRQQHLQNMVCRAALSILTFQ